MAGEYGSAVSLPPGFRFGPTDEELILHFLLPKARRMRCYPDIIPDLGYSMPDPRQLHGKALWSENQYYFFMRRVKEDDDDDEEEEMMMMSSSSNGMWKEVEDDGDLGEEGIIFSGNSRVIGLKKLLVFCDHEAPENTTNWFMQQYSLHHSSTSSFNTPAAAAAAAGIFIGGGSLHHDDHQYDNLGYCKWTLCRVEERKGRLHQSLSYNDEEDNGSQLSCLDEMYLEFDDDSDVTFPN